VLLVTIVDSAPEECGMEQADDCLHPFQNHLDQGVGALAGISDEQLVNICWLLKFTLVD